MLVGVFEVRDTPASTMSASSQSSHATPSSCAIVIMDRVDPGEIGLVHHVLAPGPSDRFLAQLASSATVTASSAATIGRPSARQCSSSRLPRVRVDQCEHHQPGIRGQFVDDPVEMRLRAHHRPEMPDHVGVVELAERRLGDHLERLAGRVRQQVEVKPGHAAD